MRTRFNNIHITAVIVLLVVVVAACSGDGESDTSITLPEGVTLPEATVPETTTPDTAPETTAPPATEAPASEASDAAPESEDDGVPAWVWVLIILLLVGFVSWIGARAGARSKTAAPPQQPPAPPPDEPDART